MQFWLLNLLYLKCSFHVHFVMEPAYMNSQYDKTSVVYIYNCSTAPPWRALKH
jgi:hypothetical protein